MSWLRRVLDRLLPARSERKAILGTWPGMVWEPARNRWVNESETYDLGGGRRYQMVGPIYTNCGLHP